MGGADIGARIGAGRRKGKGFACLTHKLTFRKSFPMRTIYLNGIYMPETQGKVSVFDRGFLFSDAVYEVVSVIDGKLIDFDGHIKRLTRSLGELGIIGAPDAAVWLDICRQLVQRNALTEGMIYWQVTRGQPSDRSFYFPPNDTPPTVLAFTQSVALVDNPAAGAGIKVVTLPDLRWGRADIKTTQLLYASMMKMEAKARGADDAWLVRDGFVTEGTSQNAHIVTKNGVLVTHQLDRNILHGITRVAVLELADDLKLTFEERAFTVAEAQDGAEAFVSAASAFVMPVVEINGVKLGDGKPGPVATALRKTYIDWARENAI
jgi:D-alanine transaminase